MEANVNTNRSISVVNGTIDREAHPKHWYVAQVRMKCEKKTASQIEKLGIETFVPVQKEIHQWTDRKKEVDKLIIPLIVFFKSDETVAKEVERLSFVYSLLKSPGQNCPALIPDNQIENFRRMLSQQVAPVSIVRTYSFKKGDKVKVVRGPMKGVTGIVHYTPKGAEICVEVDMLGYACASISQTDLQFN